MIGGDPVEELIRRAFAEDLGSRGDITSESVIPADATSDAVVVTRRPGCIAGVDVASACFRHVDPTIIVDQEVPNGIVLASGSPVMTVSGRTRSLLTAERVALNFLGRMSGIATATRAFVDAVAGTGAAISDTRKTTPGMRVIERRAVVAGGGINHRFGLFDAVLIKDNHIAAAASIAAAVSAARAAVGPGVEVEVEVDTIDQLEQVMATDADIVLLDNMDIDQLARAVDLVAGRCRTEASGGVTLETVRRIAETGVDVISVGWLTHSAPALDVALDIVV